MHHPATFRADPALLDRAKRWRRHLHSHPEVGLEVPETAAYLARTCTELGWQVTRDVGGHGLVATLRRGTSDRAIALRADMDALPITEDTGVAHTSYNPGAMHACGHDGHMAMLLGAAAALADLPDGADSTDAGAGFDGTVHLLFQPAEEPGLGAAAMIADGLFERFPADAVYGLHNLPGAPAGHVWTRPGPIMAAEDDFVITLHGRGGHASAPHLVIDPLVVAAHVVLALQSIVARSTDPAHGAVVSCTDVVTDGARNALPTTVTITGDSRSFTPGDSQLIEERLTTLAQGTAAAHGARAEVSYTREFRPTVNDAARVADVVAAATAAVGADHVQGECTPQMASEDFGLFAERVPGCFAFVGTGEGPEDGGTPLHSKGYDFNDDVLGVGIALYVNLVRSTLAPQLAMTS